MSRWYQISFVLPSAMSDLVSARLFDVGCSGLQEEDVSHEDMVRLRAYFAESEDRGSVLRALQTFLDEAHLPIEVHVDDVPEVDWSASWLAHFKPIYPTPRIAVSPPWDRAPDPLGGFTIVIEPKMAFGTGHHETTRLALAEVEKWVYRGCSVLDVGAGSGILSIAAMKLGAQSVTAVETDSPAVENARENLEANGVAEGVDLILGSIDTVDGAFDVVVANIISSILTPMLPDVFRRVRPGGRVILGGALVREQAAFIDAVQSSGLMVDETLTDGEWLCVTAHRKEHEDVSGM